MEGGLNAKEIGTDGKILSCMFLLVRDFGYPADQFVCTLFVGITSKPRREREREGELEEKYSKKMGMYELDGMTRSDRFHAT